MADPANVTQDPRHKLLIDKIGKLENDIRGDKNVISAWAAAGVEDEEQKGVLAEKEQELARLKQEKNRYIFGQQKRSSPSRSAQSPVMNPAPAASTTDTPAIANDPRVKDFNQTIRNLESGIQTATDEIESWLAGGFDSRAQKETRSDLEKQLSKVKRDKQNYIVRRQNPSRAVEQDLPRSAERPAALSAYNTPTSASHLSSSNSSRQPNTVDTSPWAATGWRSHIQPTQPDAKQEPGVSRETPSLRNGRPPIRPGGSANPTLTPSSALTPNGSSSGLSSLSSNKRDFAARNSIDLHSPGPSKRPRGTESPSLYSSSNPVSRPVSRGSSGSGFIDLTGGDDDIKSSIDRHNKKVEGIRSSHPPQNGNALPVNGNAQRVFARPQNLPQYTPQHLSSSLQYSNQPNAYVPATPSYPQIHIPTNSYTQASAWSFPPQNQRHTMPGSFPPDSGPIYLGDSDDDSLTLVSAPSPPSRASGSGTGQGLSGIINRTNNYDLTTMTDGFGNPLNSAVVARARGLMEDVSPMDQADIDQLLAGINPGGGAGVPANDREGVPEGLKCPLYDHQKRALKWMKEKEESVNKGGILADDMGLGKTISMLALILARPPKPLETNDDDLFGDKFVKPAEFVPKTNLIVAPKALLRQWEDEIKKKVRPGHEISVCIHHGSHKEPARKLMQYDVVLTTYQTLLADHTKLDKFWSSHEGRNVDTDTDPTLAREVSFFHPRHTKFHRVILDESQVIKNDKSKTTIAAWKIVADYRWCMSGTPIMNSVEELYPLFKFLRLPQWSDKKKFKRQFGSICPKPPQGTTVNSRNRAMQNLQVALTATMLRRSKKTKIDGKPIIVLPNKSEEIVDVHFDEDQMSFYKELENNAQVKVNKYLRDGTWGKHYYYILVLLLRLRQSCCHPHLLLDSDEDSETTDKMLSLAKSLAPDVIQRIKKKSLDIIDSINRGFECPICYDTLPDPRIPFPCGHEICAPCLDAHAANARRENLRNGEENGQVKCAVCRAPLETEKFITYKAFKKMYMPELLGSEDEDEYGDEDSDDSDGSAGSDVEDDEDGEDVDEHGNLRDFVLPDTAGDEIFVAPNRPNAGDSVPKKKKKKKQKIKASMLKTLRKAAKKNAKTGRQYRRYLNQNWLSSAKVNACLDVLRKIKNEANGEKTLVFSQWTMFLDLIEVALARDEDLKGLKALRYDGEMSMAQRDEAFRQFRDDDSTKVMLLSLRAGNAGLNLVSASRVIIMDPFWNPYIEMQAVDRAYRIGQQKDVKVYRLLVKETIEDRIMALQNNKREMVDQALDEGVAKKVSGLSFHELKRLFAMA